MEWNYHYTISKENSFKKFKETCAVLDVECALYEKKPLVVDVDGSTVQLYKRGTSRVVVIDDYDIGAVVVNSDIELRFLQQ